MAASSSTHQFQLIAAEAMHDAALALVAANPDVFTYHKTSWGKFPDGTDRIQVGGYVDGKNLLAGKHVVFLASFHNNDVTLSQFYVLVVLCEAFIKSLTVVLPFYPTGTMERVVVEGEVATASTMARLFSSLPSPGRPIRVMIYDIHTLQNRFYISNHAVADLCTAVPLVLPVLADHNITTIVYPDDGACKRFGHMFKAQETVICGKIRDGETRLVHIQDGNPEGRHVLIIDDLVQTGGTLYECAVALKKRGAASVSAFVVHAVFPKGCFTRFLRGQDRDVFAHFFVTNSNPAVTKLLPVGSDSPFQVLDLTSQLAHDIQHR